MEAAPELFGRLPDGRAVHRYTLTNGQVEVRFLSYGGIITSIRVPDREGTAAEVTLGHADLASYQADQGYLGALIGRYANRIAGGRISVDGRDYALDVNNGPNHLHGGRTGFGKVLWAVEPRSDPAGEGATLRYISPAGDGGYPGTLAVRVTYTLTRENELVFDYHATADAPTPVNLTQHSYFNLSGRPGSDILDHELQLHARHFTPVNAALIPTGEIRRVEGTRFDFTAPTRVGAHIDADDEQLAWCGGYDHNFVLDREAGATPTLAARLTEPRSGRVLTVLTTEPGLQFYSGNFLGAGDGAHRRRSGLTLETQHFPDSPNHAGFPPTILRAGQEFSSRTVYRFSTE